jgi:AraC-like DNA-binding protein
MLEGFKYLTHGSDDKLWGLYLTVVGSSRVMPNMDYPQAGHPTGYHFSWNNGRILQEYQVNYITQGEGIMETRNGTFPIAEGSIILVRPNVWHRYRPVRKVGWYEHYIGFTGDIARKMITSSEILNTSPVINIGFQENILKTFQEIVNQVDTEKPGYHQICAGLVINILGQIISFKKNENFRHNPVESAIQKACMTIRDSPSHNLNIEKLADALKINYSIFRKSFKKYTGLSPMQYHTSLRMKQAVHLLTHTNSSIKEISYSLGFCSVFYFSKMFKEKTGYTPSAYRKMNEATGEE